MKDEYDFSKAERGRFYHPDAEMELPVYLDQEVRDYFAEKAKAQGIGTETLVNDLLRKEMALIQSVTG